jgi:hypothetical protein
MTTSSSSLELNTVLAALRYFQANYSEAVPLFDGELGELLSCDAIDSLCERINSDAVENVLSNLTDETYSTSPVPTDKEVVEREDALQQMLDELAKTPGKLMVEGMLAFIRNFADYTGRKTIARITLSALEHLVENPEEVNDSFAEALVDYALRDRKLVTNEELKLRLAGALHREGLLASADGSEDTPEFVYPSITWLIDCVCNDGLRKETYRDNAISWCATLMRATSIMIEELTEIS